MKQVKPGSIFRLTDREEYLWDSLRPYLPNGKDWVREGDKLSAALHSPYSMPIEEEIELRQYLGELIFDKAWEYMDSIAPKGYYFGVRPNDGSEFGYWPLSDLPGYLDEQELVAFAWLGGYPLYYIQENCILCPDCADDLDSFEKKQLTECVNWDDPHLYCDECGKHIEAAYELEESAAV